MRKIAVGVRHRDLIVRDRSVKIRRLFASWDMAFIAQARIRREQAAMPPVATATSSHCHQATRQAAHVRQDQQP